MMTQEGEVEHVVDGRWQMRGVVSAFAVCR